MRQLHNAVLLCLLGFCLPPYALAQENTRDMTARKAFVLLPSTIFENTVEGLNEGEKSRLLADGQAEFWQMSDETGDALLFTALPFHDSAVALRLFHAADGEFCLAAIGTVGGSLCTLEFWKIDNAGRIVPVDSPPEPDIKDFLDTGQVLPKGLQPSAILCLDYDGLTAQPLFWSETGLVDVPFTKSVRYQWNGREFKGHISAKTAHPTPQ